jgi:hypothetical protein
MFAAWAGNDHRYFIGARQWLDDKHSEPVDIHDFQAWRLPKTVSTTFSTSTTDEFLSESDVL